MGGTACSIDAMLTVAQVGGIGSADSFLFVATALFACAVVHAFCAPVFARLARKREAASPGFGASALHLLGEVEAVFALWATLLFAVAACWPGKGWAFAVAYLESGDYAAALRGEPATGPSKFLEPLFVFMVMAMAASRPIMEASQRALDAVARLFGGGTAARWCVVLTLAPLLGSVITEPAAMTIAATLLAAQFYRLKPSLSLRYATLALLFVNVSVGGALTHFAAPPIVMVAAKWGWGTAEVFQRFGVAAMASVVLSNALYFLWFRRELLTLPSVGPAGDGGPAVPLWLTCAHVALIAWVVAMLSGHHALLMVAGFGAFVALGVATPRWQWPLRLRAPFMVGMFLAGLVVLGGLQAWWIGPWLEGRGAGELLAVSVVLTSFNDNAAVTYLASQVPALALSGAEALRYAILAGALAGGGLTVIANAPNPAGQAILGEFFEQGVSPWRLLAWALLPTGVAVATFLFWS